MCLSSSVLVPPFNATSPSFLFMNMYTWGVISTNLKSSPAPQRFMACLVVIAVNSDAAVSKPPVPSGTPSVSRVSSASAKLLGIVPRAPTMFPSPRSHLGHQVSHVSQVPQLSF